MRKLLDSLPAPLTDLRDASGLPQFSEAKSLEYIKHYSEDIGYRIVGTPEMDTTLEYTMQVLEQLKNGVPKESQQRVEIEIMHQKDDGAHLFDFMDKVRRFR